MEKIYKNHRIEVDNEGLFTITDLKTNNIVNVVESFDAATIAVDEYQKMQEAMDPIPLNSLAEKLQELPLKELQIIRDILKFATSSIRINNAFDKGPCYVRYLNDKLKNEQKH